MQRYNFFKTIKNQTVNTVNNYKSHENKFHDNKSPENKFREQVD